MKTIKGTYNSAVVFTDDIEAKAEEQLIELLSQEMVSESKIRIMPDCHAGTGCVIGTTMTITDKICPNLVGVDIGCGMLTARTAGTILLKSIRMRTAGITLSFIPVQGARGLNVRVIIRISPQNYTLNYRKTWHISKADW